MTVRRFGALLRGLPASARVWAEANGGWTVTDHVLADVWEAVMATRAAVVATVTTKPGQRLKLDAPSYPGRPRPKQPKRQAKGWAAGFARRMIGGG